MRPRPAASEKPLHWVGSSKRDLLAFPEKAVQFRKAIYVLHAFQKKSPTGIRTPATDVDLIRRRLKAAREDYEVRYGKEAD